MKAKDLIDLKTEMLEPLHNVAVEVSDIDRRGKAHLLEYTELDVVAAAVVFTHIMANKKAHSQVEITNVKDFEKVVGEMRDYGIRIRQLVKEMTGVDLNENIKKGENNERGENKSA